MVEVGRFVDDTLLVLGAELARCATYSFSDSALARMLPKEDTAMLIIVSARLARACYMMSKYTVMFGEMLKLEELLNTIICLRDLRLWSL